MPSAADYQAAILEEIGDTAQNAVFELLLPAGTTAGTLTIDFNSSSPTAALAYNAAPGSVQGEVEALDTVGSGNAVVTGNKKGPYYFEMMGELAGQPVILPTADGSALTPAATLVFVQVQEPQLPRYATEVVLAWNTFSNELNDEIRKLRAMRVLAVKERGRLSALVDQSTATEESKDSQRFAQMKAIIDDIDHQIVIQSKLELSASALQLRTGLINRRTPNGLLYGQLKRDPITGGLI
jgi:hypothetical protein